MDFNPLFIDEDRIKSLAPPKAITYLRERISMLQSERKMVFSILFLLSLIFFINTWITLTFSGYSTYFAVLSILIIVLLGWYIWSYARYSRALKTVYRLFHTISLKEIENG